MKLLSAIAIGLTTLLFTSCSSENKELTRRSEEILDTLGSKSQTNIELQDKDQPLRDEEYLGAKLKPIWAELAQIKDLREWTKIQREVISDVEETGTATYYYLEEALRKVEFQKKGEALNSIEYYLKDEQVFFVFEKRAKESELESGTAYDAIEDSFFFDKDGLFRIKSNQDPGAPFAEEYRGEEDERLKNLLVKLLP